MFVAEVSSFQLQLTAHVSRPSVAVWLNLAPDHLDWHGTFDAYAAAKARDLGATRRDGDVAVVNADDPVVVEAARAGPGGPHVTFGRDRGDYHVGGRALVTPDGSRSSTLDGARPCASPRVEQRARGAARRRSSAGATARRRRSARCSSSAPSPTG